MKVSRHVQLLITALILLSAGAFILYRTSVPDQIVDHIFASINSKETPIFIGTMLVVMGGYISFLLLVDYLNSGARSFLRIKIGPLAVELTEPKQKHQVQVEKTPEPPAKMNTEGANLSLINEEQSIIFENPKNKIIDEISTPKYSKITTKVDVVNTQNSQNRELFELFDMPRQRLGTELASLGRRGNLNLVLGAFTTLIGLVLLGVSVFSEVITVKGDTWAFVSHFVPRLTLVILIELFAFFFLSLYKSSLAEIKYFQNELTNIESKLLALRAAIAHGDKKTVADIIAKLAATERNHVLTKGQTTVELEKARMEQDTENMVVKHVATLIRKPPIWKR